MKGDGNGNAEEGEKEGTYPRGRVLSAMAGKESVVVVATASSNERLRVVIAARGLCEV